MPTQTEKIRDLNDDLRQHLLTGGVVITPVVHLRTMPDQRRLSAA